MPVQRTLFGRPIPRIPPRRVAQLLGCIAAFAVITLVFTLPNSIPSGPSLSKFTDTKISLPKIPTKLSTTKLNPFRPTAHAPPVQKNSTSGDSSWYSDWNWLSPFSSSVTLDENRSLLPPLLERPPIYTYYDHKLKRDAETRDAENEILVTWRRAWWAQGFKPIILGPGEAMNNPLYEEMQKLDLESGMQAEISKWLAWDTMGTGILCHYLTLPMGPHEDALLSYLRRGEYPQLLRYDGLKNGLFSGPKVDVSAMLKAALESPDVKKAKDLLDVIPSDSLKVDTRPEGVAFYDDEVVKSKYPKIASDILETGPKGLRMLNQLMNAHLHNTWQNLFYDGIVVLKPHPEHMTAILERAVNFATYLAQCPDSPMLSSCPPNRPKCKPCVASSPMRITTPPYYRNVSSRYIIGVIPHPYTLTSAASLRNMSTLDIPFIRRETTRDAFLFTITKELLGNGLSSAARLPIFKSAIASPHGTHHSLWISAERPFPTDLEWYFGFTIPKIAADDGRSETPVPGPERRPPPPEPVGGPKPDDKELEQERELLELAKAVISSKDAHDTRIRDAVEAWSLGDVEIWRFVRAFRARSRVERQKWEDEEKKYSGGAGADRGGKEGWGRWFDFDEEESG